MGAYRRHHAVLYMERLILNTVFYEMLDATIRAINENTLQ